MRKAGHYTISAAIFIATDCGVDSCQEQTIRDVLHSKRDIYNKMQKANFFWLIAQNDSTELPRLRDRIQGNGL